MTGHEESSSSNKSSSGGSGVRSNNNTRPNNDHHLELEPVRLDEGGRQGVDGLLAHQWGSPVKHEKGGVLEEGPFNIAVIVTIVVVVSTRTRQTTTNVITAGATSKQGAGYTKGNVTNGRQ